MLSRQRMYQLKNLAEGKCQFCKNPHLSNNKMCEYHRDKLKNYNHQRRIKMNTTPQTGVTYHNSREKLLNDPMNIISLMNRIMNLEQRVGSLEKLNNIPQNKKPKPLVTRIGKFETYAFPIMNDQKMWSTHQLAEEIRLRYPDVPNFTIAAIQGWAARSTAEGKLTRIGQNVYRIKPAVQS